MDFSSIPARSAAGWLLRLPLRLIPAQARLRVLQGPLRGKQWIAGAGNHSCWLGCYEPNKQRELEARIKPGDVFYDWGAHAGYFSLMGSVLAGPEGRVVSFEPLPYNIRYLRRHLELNNIRNCIVVEAAVTSSEASASFEEAESGYQGRLRESGAAGARAIVVRTVTVDGMVSRGEIPPPDIIKCDVEGADLDALHGAKATLRAHRPVILLDRDSGTVLEDCCEFLRGLGYRMKSLDGRPLDDSVEILAVHPDRKNRLERTTQPFQPVF